MNLTNNKFIFFFLFILPQGLYSQHLLTTPQTNQPSKSDTLYWKIGGTNTLTSSHVSLTNWAAGGENSISVNVGISLFADYLKDRDSWENSLNLAYGVVKQGGSNFSKSDDQINLVTKYGYQIKSDNSSWFFSLLLDFRTQFARGYGTVNTDSVISRFMAPGYLLVGLGIDFKPKPAWSFNYIPLTGKFTFVTDHSLSDLGAYGVDTGRVSRKELGSFFRIKYKSDIWANINLDTRLELFTNYIENFGNIDVNWQNVLILTVNKWLKVYFNSQLIYDDDVRLKIDEKKEGMNKDGPYIQFKSIFGAGINVEFGEKRDKNNQ